MKADPEQRAVQLGEYIAAHNATVRAAAAAFGCSKSTVHKDVAVRLRSIRPVPYWPATRPSAICGAGLPPGADTAAAKAKKDRCAVQRSFLAGTFLNSRRAALAIFGGKHNYNLWFKNVCGRFEPLFHRGRKKRLFYPSVWNCCKAPFSNRLTCA